MKQKNRAHALRIDPLVVLIAVLIFVNPLFFTTQKQLFFPSKIIIQQILILIILLVYIFSKQHSKIRLSQPIILFCIYFLYVFIRTLVQPIPSFGFQQLYYLVPYIVLFIILSQLTLHKNEMLFLSNAFLLSFIISIIFGFYFQAKYSSFSDFSRLQLTWANANYLASYLLVIIGFTFYIWKTTKARWIHISALIIMVIALIFLFWTQSRGGLLSLLFVLLISYFIYAIKRKKKRHIAIASLISIFLIIGSICVFRTIRPQTFIYRTRIYKADVQYIKDNILFGSGLGTFVREFPQYRLSDYKLVGQEDIISHAHNEFIEIWAETGIVGLILFVLFLIVLFNNFRRNWDSKNKYFLYGAGYSLVFLLIHNLFSITMRIPPILIYFFILAGFLSAGFSKKDFDTPHKSISKYMMVIFIVILTISIIQQYKTLQGLRHYAKSKQYYATKDKKMMTSAIREGEKAAQYIPNHADLLYHQGLLYTLQEDHINALKTYNKLEEISPYYPQLYFWKGYLLSLSGDWAGSIESYRTEIKYNEYPKVYFNLAIAYHYIGDERSSMLHFLFFVEKIKVKIEKHLIKDKQQIMKEEARNLKFALNNLANYHKNNLDLMNRINELQEYFFSENDN